MAKISSNISVEDSLSIVDGDEKRISAKVFVNLQSYIDIFNAEGQNGLNFKSSIALLSDQVSGLSGHLFWENILNCAIKNTKLTLQQQYELKNSPACQYMYDGFVEILKNVMDEAILGHYEYGIAPQLELILDIDLSIAGQVTLTLTDNGRGFPLAFLEKTATLQDKDKYIRENKGSSKLDTRNLPPLFGGAGLGLRILMAKTLYGAVLTGPGVLIPKYEKPTVSEIYLENKASSLFNEHGAVIIIRTSLAPLVEKQIQFIRNDTPILKLPIQRKAQTLSDAGSYKKTMTFFSRKDTSALQPENSNCNIEDNESRLSVSVTSWGKLKGTSFLLSENLHGHFSRNNVSTTLKSADESLGSVASLKN
jgi:hypothetical protein